MDELRPRETCEVVDVADHAPFDLFSAQTGRGIRFVAEHYGPETGAVLKPDTGDFVKWLKSAEPTLTVEVDPAKTLVLHSNEIWIPLAFLAKDIALPVYLNLVSSYLYARFKNALKG